MAGEIEAAGEPPSRRHNQLSAAVGRRLAEVSDGGAKGVGVGSFAVADGTELGDRHGVLPAGWIESAVVMEPPIDVADVAISTAKNRGLDRRE